MVYNIHCIDGYQDMPSFLDNFDEDIRASLIEQFRTLWTHHSTAIEGNTLTLGDTAFVLGEGLTVAGKPVKDHQEVIGHARAIDILLKLVDEHRDVVEQDLFDLHKSIQIAMVMDIMKPYGAWKREPNGTTVVVNGKLTYNDTYALPQDVPVLMGAWLKSLNRVCSAGFMDDAGAVHAYADLNAGFVRIHPFWDGNGRLARLLANLPVLKAGYPPVVILSSMRDRYLRLLAEWEMAVGRVMPGVPLLSEHEKLSEFRLLCAEAWQESINLVGQARTIQQMRTKSLRKE